MVFLMSVPVETPALKRSNTELENFISRIANGEQEAFEALYAEIQAAVFGFALSILKNRQDAEDVMQDSFLKIYHAAAGYRPQGKPMAWIFTIVRNEALQRIRAASRTDALPEENHLAAVPCHTQQTINRVVLETALQALTDEERQIVFLHALSGLKHREVSEVLKISLSTELSKYHRALAKMKKQIQGGGPDENE